MNNLIVKLLFKSLVNRDQILFMGKLFALSIFADNQINALELNELKKDINLYINTYYTMLNDFFKKQLKNYLYKITLHYINNIKNDEKYMELYRKEVFYEIKLLKQKNEYNKINHIINFVENILKSDLVFTIEEKRFLGALLEIIKDKK